MAHDGMHAFEYPAIDSRFNDVFNQGMHCHTTLIMKMILEVYPGFKEITEIVDVGGGTGATLAKIIAKYPHIRGINFDLAHVIKDAAPLAGNILCVWFDYKKQEPHCYVIISVHLKMYLPC